jgi:glucosyl-3-phosphoglycerate synthase
MLIDIVNRFGVDAIAQVDLGRRIHRNRPLTELSPMAAQVMQAALHRIAPGLAAQSAVLNPPDLTPIDIVYRERPPLVTVPAYLAAHPR